MKRNSLLLILIIISVIFLAAACGLLQAPAPQPLLSATDIPPQATSLDGLPPTWTPIPTEPPTPTIPPSSTPLPTQDPENYQISLALTPMVESYPQTGIDRSGWKILEGKTASIEIPPEYEILDFAGTFMEIMFGMMEAFAEGFTEMAVELGEEMGVTPEAELETPDLGEMPEFDFLIAMEESTTSAIILVSTEITPETTTEDLINEALSDQENDIRPISRISYSDGPYPMERVILDVEDPELGPGKQVIYVIMGDNMGWNLVFAAPAALFEESLPLFESAVQSFQVK
jgi:hypothetical protein